MNHAIVFVIGLTVLRTMTEPLPLPNLGNTCYMNALLQNLFNVRPLNFFLLSMESKYGGTLIPAYIELLREYDAGIVKNDLLKTFYSAVDTVMLRMPFVRWMRNLAYLGSVNRIIIVEQFSIKEIQLKNELNDLKMGIENKVPGAQEKYNMLNAFLNFIQQELDVLKNLILDEVAYDFFSDLEKRFVIEASKLSYRQEDASEFYLGFVDALVDVETAPSEAINYFGTLLQGKLTTIFSSKKLTIKSEKTEKITYLPIPLAQHDTIAACIADFFTTKDIGSADVGGVKADDVQEQILFSLLPDILVLQLNRYDVYGAKLMDARVLPFSLSLYEYREKSLKINSSDADYTLIGIVLHLGGSTGSGHYVAYVQDVFSANWSLCDDSVITKIGRNFISQKGYDETRNAYLLFYMRQPMLEDIRKADTLKRETELTIDSLAHALSAL